MVVSTVNGIQQLVQGSFLPGTETPLGPVAQSKIGSERLVAEVDYPVPKIFSTLLAQVSGILLSDDGIDGERATKDGIDHSLSGVVGN